MTSTTTTPTTCSRCGCELGLLYVARDGADYCSHTCSRLAATCPQCGRPAHRVAFNTTLNYVAGSLGHVFPAAGARVSA
jgi:primosomal protein N'